MKNRRRLLIATNNAGKIREIKEILSDIPLELKTLDDINFDKEIPETGRNFEENAVMKAKFVGEKTKLLTLAEDSGLEVDALGGRPGVLSARYALGSDLDRINKLLRELKGIPKEKRTARFRTFIALFIPSSYSGEPRFNRGDSRIRFWTSQNDNDSGQARMTEKGKVITFGGISEGYITEKPIGKNGFGYDPIFFNLDLGKTNGQTSLEEKNRVSHRARALLKLKKFLKQL